MANILTLIPVKPNIIPGLRERAIALLKALRDREHERGEHTIEAHIRDCPEVGDGRRFSPHAAARNAMLDRYLHKHHTHVLWIDADLVGYPPDLPSWLHAIEPAGIVAPLPLIEGSARFYDVLGFVEPDGRHAHPWPPYLRDEGELVAMQAVGACYLAPAELFQSGLRYEPVPSQTEHYSVCIAHAVAGYRVSATRAIQVAHADLPKWGEPFH